MLSRKPKTMESERKMDSPIIIMGASRSGTSLTAGIFDKHGVWSGNCMSATRINPKGFFENKRMKRFFKQGKLTADAWEKEVKDILDNEGYDGGKYLFKHGAERWHLWDNFTNKKLIVCRRPYEAVYKSRKKAGFSEMSRSAWNKWQTKLDNALNENGGCEVFADDFKKGDFSSIISALEYCDIKPDMNKIEEFYEPKYWNYSS